MILKKRDLQALKMIHLSQKFQKKAKLSLKVNDRDKRLKIIFYCKLKFKKKNNQ